MNKYIIIVLLIFPAVHKCFSQSNNLSSSPYSLYGLGISNELNTGKTNALGRTGIALPSSTAINNLNPASYAAIPLNRFLYDVGLQYEFNDMEDRGGEDTKNNGNFSNLAFALPINERSGIGLSLMPYTRIGYSISEFESSIEGSTNTYYTSITGYGGLSDLKLNYGYALKDNFRLGASASVLFGKVKETETNVISNNILILNEDNHYSGLRIGLGVQYDVTDNFSIGSIFNLPTILNGDQVQDISQYYYGTLISSLIEENVISSFSLPSEMGVGFNAKILKNLSVTGDYRREFWNATNQTDGIGTYIDKNFFGLGAEFKPSGNPLDYTNYIQYRAGFNYDSGNLSIDGNPVNSYALSLGVGLPVKTGTNSMFNLMYSYGSKGQVSDGLIKENYHLLSLNISLEDIWFVKPKFD